MTARRALPLLLVLGLVGAAEVARADDAAAAKSLFDEGSRLYDAGDFTGACPKFEASLKLDPENLDTRGKLAFCYEKQGRLATAWTAWRDVNARAKRANRVRAQEIATQHIADLEPKLAKMTLVVPPANAVPGLEVKKDGVVVPGEGLGIAVAVDRGTRKIEASAPGYKPWAVEVVIEDGQQRTVEIGPLEQDPDAVKVTPPGGGGAGGIGGGGGGPVEPAAPPSKTRKYLGMATLGVGVVLLGVGGVAGLNAMSTRDDARAAGCNDDLSMCPVGEALTLAKDAYDAANLSTTLVIGGAVLAVGGTILWLTAPKARSSASRDTAWRVAPVVGADGAGLAASRSF